MRTKSRLTIGLALFTVFFMNISIINGYYTDMKDCNTQRIRTLVNRSCAASDKRSERQANSTRSNPASMASGQPDDNYSEELNPGTEEDYFDFLMNSIVKNKRIPRSKQNRMYKRITKRQDISYDMATFKTVLHKCCSDTGCTSSDFTIFCTS